MVWYLTKESDSSRVSSNGQSITASTWHQLVREQPLIDKIMIGIRTANQLQCDTSVGDMREFCWRDRSGCHCPRHCQEYVLSRATSSYWNDQRGTQDCNSN